MGTTSEEPTLPIDHHQHHDCLRLLTFVSPSNLELFITPGQDENMEPVASGDGSMEYRHTWEVVTDREHIKESSLFLTILPVLLQLPRDARIEGKESKEEDTT